MIFSRWVFRIAGVYGALALVPQYFMEEHVGRIYPPAITHPEYFYGFIGVAVAWQVAFLVIAQDPTRYRLLMIPAFLEKATFGLATVVLFTLGRIQASLLGFGIVDLVLGILFLVAFWRSTSRDEQVTN